MIDHLQYATELVDAAVATASESAYSTAETFLIDVRMAGRIAAADFLRLKNRLSEHMDAHPELFARPESEWS